VTTKTSLQPGFYRLSLSERRQRLADYLERPVEALIPILESGGLLPIVADKVVENVLGTYALPFGVALNFTVNGVDRWIPMVVEEPSVIAAASNAAQRVRSGGGFRATVVENWMTAQVQLHEVADPVRGTQSILAAKDALLELARTHVASLVARGGGPRDLEVRDLGEGYLVVHIHVDCRDAMGANLVNRVAEGIGSEVARLAGGTLGLRILTNLCDRRRVVVSCRVEKEGLVKATERAGDPRAEEHLDEQASRIALAIERASRFAELDPYRAATHNKGIMNGLDSVVIATGNDYRAVEAGAHAFAARSGSYRPLATWRREGTALVGRMELPLSLGIVGGTLKTHPTARLALELLGVTSASELEAVAACAGLASNLSALRALATEGIQRGHLSLHARSVALAAGAVGDEVEAIAGALGEQRVFSEERARELLDRLRAKGSRA
jgi:hydroxymethylglutaryl-CoA reductase